MRVGRAVVARGIFGAACSHCCVCIYGLYVVQYSISISFFIIQSGSAFGTLRSEEMRFA